MAAKLSIQLLTLFILSTFILISIYSSLLKSPAKNITIACNLFKGQWVKESYRKPLYDHTCPFHRNSWNCIKNKRQNMGMINMLNWVPEKCSLSRVDGFRFLKKMRNKRIGLVGDSLSENLVVAFLCVLWQGDKAGKKWKKMGAWRGGFFPKYNVTVAYHRAVLLAKYQWQPKKPTDADNDGVKGIHRVDVDIPADDWVHITKFYDVLIFNTGHWWGYDKFPKETPLVFYKGGHPINPPLDLMDGLKVVLKSMVSYIEREVPAKTLKFWRSQSPRHFYGGDWNQNGSCLFDEPLQRHQLDSWFDPSNNGVNKEARLLNGIIEEALEGTDIELLDLTHLSEFRADAHPAVWLGKKDAVSVWGQDCLHWCLPGVPDTWVDIISQLILQRSLETA